MTRLSRIRSTLTLLFLYWTAFVLLAIDWAHNPGFVEHPENVPYPVTDVIIVAGIVALLVAALGLFLLMPRSWNRWVAVAFRVAYVLFLVFLGLSGMVTDMAGVSYIAPTFALATLLLLSALGLWRGARRASSSRTEV